LPGAGLSGLSRKRGGNLTGSRGAAVSGYAIKHHTLWQLDLKNKYLKPATVTPVLRYRLTFELVRTF
jgi:hypothetical protein